MDLNDKSETSSTFASDEKPDAAHLAALAPLSDALARLEQNQQQIHVVNQHALAELGARLDRFEIAEATRQADAAHLTALAPLSDALARLEQNQQQIHAVNQQALAELGARLDRFEIAEVARQADAGHLTALARLEQNQQQIHAVNQQALGELGARLDHFETAEAARQVDAGHLTALARLEQNQQQIHVVNQHALAELGARLDRFEATSVTHQAVQDRFTTQVSSAMQRLAVSARSGGTTAPSKVLFTQRFETDWEFEQWRANTCPALPQDTQSQADACRFVQDDRAIRPLADALRGSLAGFAATRQALAANVELIWLLPDDSAMTDAEIEQVFGLLGVVKAIHHLQGTEPYIAVLGMRRREWIVPVLRWDDTARADMAARVPEGYGASTGLPECMPAIVIAEFEPAQAAQWARQHVAMIERVHRGHTVGIRECAVVWPYKALLDVEPFMPSLQALIEALGAANWQTTLQWVDGIVEVGDSEMISALAVRAGVQVDATATIRAQMAGIFAAYDDSLPYRPMPFDFRLPYFGNGVGPVTCIPRQDDFSVPLPADPFAETVRLLTQRLDGALDLTRRAAFQQSVARGGSHAGGWESHHIYNWKPPAALWARICVFEATQKTVSRLMLTGVDLTPACTAVEPSAIVTALAAHDGVSPLDGAANRTLQIDAHAYLTDRLAPSVDALRLAQWLPESMGDTLEIGSGFAVLAKLLTERMTSYVGFDLTIEQGHAVAAIGGIPVIGDFHALPFAADRFDSLIADNVIEHALDPVCALKEVARVLKCDGRAFLILPLDYLGADFRNPSHLWKADEASIRKALHSAGLTVIRHELVFLPKIGATGSFPSCNQTTSLWEVRRTADTVIGTQFDQLGREPVHRLDFKKELVAIDPDLAHKAELVTQSILEMNESSDLAPLARNSPALANFDWSSYLSLSEIRVVRALAILKRRQGKGRVLDLGSYFGNFSLTLRRCGWDVTAIDSYQAFQPALSLHQARLKEEGADVLDFADVGFDLSGIKNGSFDAVLCMGVIEHIPHTPRLLLETIDRVLKPGGTLVMDTPNLAYQHQRNRLAAGQSIFAPVATQFETSIPFEGHHREYTPDEIQWMMTRIGYADIALSTFNYSIYGLSELRGDDLALFHAMEVDPNRKELIMVVAKKPNRRLKSRKDDQSLPR